MELNEKKMIDDTIEGEWVIKRNFGAKLLLGGIEAKESFNQIYSYILSLYNIKGRISDNGVTFSYKREPLLKIKMSGKSLKLLFALNPDLYLASPLPIKDLRNENKEVLLPLLFKVRSRLSLKRALNLIDDLMLQKNILKEDKEVVVSDIEIEAKEKKVFVKKEGILPSLIAKEETQEDVVKGASLETIQNEVDEESLDELETSSNEVEVKEKTIYKDDINSDEEYIIKRNFGARLLLGGPKPKDDFNQIYCYLLNVYKIKGRISDTGVTFSFKREPFLKIKTAGKSLKLLFALNPDDYKDSPIPVKDLRKEGEIVKYSLLFKVRSHLSLKRAFNLIDDMMAKLNLVKEEVSYEVVDIELNPKEKRILVKKKINEEPIDESSFSLEERLLRSSKEPHLTIPKRIENKVSLKDSSNIYLDTVAPLITTDNDFAKLLVHLSEEKGKIRFGQSSRMETKIFDESFIKELEEGFDALDWIVMHPGSTIKEFNQLMEAGLARKINAATIVHLASHTQFVYDIDEKGNVTPEKLNAPTSDVNYQTYENRFIMTLINKAALFIEKRYQFILEHGETFDSELLILKAETQIEDAKVEIDSRIKVSKPSKDSGLAEKNAKLLERLKLLRSRVAFYCASPFMMELMRGSKGVANPIHQTNIIVKEPHYKKAYTLWKFLDSYDQLGVSYSVTENKKEFDESYYNQLYSLLGASIATLRSDIISAASYINKGKVRTIKPKIIFSLESETFHNGRFLYDQFPEKKPLDTYLKPSPEEVKKTMQKLQEKFSEYDVKKALIESEIEAQKIKDEMEEALERQRHLDEIERERLRAIEEAKIAAEERRKEEERAKEAELARIQAEEDDYLEKLREEIVRQAMLDAAENQQEETITYIQRNFSSKILNAEEKVYRYFLDLHNYLTKCYGINARISDFGDTFTYKKVKYAMILLSGKTLRVINKLDIGRLSSTSIPIESNTSSTTKEALPSLLRITSDLALKREKMIIDMMMADANIPKIKDEYSLDEVELNPKEKEVTTVRPHFFKKENE